MRYNVKTFKTIYAAPGWGIGTYSLGKKDIKEISVEDAGIVVTRWRSDLDKESCLFTWANIAWAQISPAEPAKKAASKKNKEE